MKNCNDINQQNILLSQYHTKVISIIERDLKKTDKCIRWKKFDWRNFIYRKLKDYSKGLKTLYNVVSGSTKLPSIVEVFDTQDLNDKLCSY